VFVCLNEREPDNPKGCCKHRGADAVFTALKMGAKKAGLAKKRANQPGRCIRALRVRPKRRHLSGGCLVSRAHRRGCEEILREHVVGGKVVERC
jgi:hypothetical protein